MRKKEFFLDYHSVNKYLKRQKGDTERLANFSVKTQSEALNVEECPLSCRKLINKEPVVEYAKTINKESRIKLKSAFQEGFFNRYYPQVVREESENRKAADEHQRERANQIYRVSHPVKRQPLPISTMFSPPTTVSSVIVTDPHG